MSQYSFEKIEVRLKEVEDKIQVSCIQQEKTNVELCHLRKILTPLSLIPVILENHKVRIEALEKEDNVRSKNRWKAITAILGTFITSMFALLYQLFNK